MATSDPRPALARLLREQHRLTAATSEEIAACFVPRAFARGAFVARAGERDDALYFVQSGVWRVFYTSASGKEFNKAFVYDGMFFVALSAHLEQQPLRFDVQALSNSVAMAMPYPAFERRMEADLELAGMWRRYMQSHFLRHEAREAALQLEDAEGRYRWFLARYPGLVDRVPLYHVASYLGLTDVTLSRVRRSLAGRS